MITDYELLTLEKNVECRVWNVQFIVNLNT